MKPAPILITASLALNAVLLAFVITARTKNTASPSYASPSPSSSTSSDSAHSGSSSPVTHASPEALAAAIKSRDYAALRDQLHALGLSDSAVRNVMRTILWQPYLDRQFAINSAKNSPDDPYWRGLPPTGRRAYTREERAELRQMASELRDQMVAVLGAQAFDATTNYSQRYSFLTPESAAKLADLDRDYGEMRQEINQESERFKVPSDADKLKFLEKERRADLEATLTPAELEEYNLRYSPAAYTLRSRVSQIDLTETEYRDLYDLQQAYYNIQADTALARPQRNQRLTPEQLAQYQERVKTHDSLNEEIRQVMGDERYALYQRASDNDYRQLQAAADRFNIEPKVVNQVYDYRDAVSTASQRIAADSSLTPDQKKQALVTLATNTRQKITNDLGSEVSTAYLDKNMKWLERVQAGNVLTFAPNSNRATYKPVAPAASRDPNRSSATYKVEDH